MSCYPCVTVTGVGFPRIAPARPRSGRPSVPGRRGRGGVFRGPCADAQRRGGYQRSAKWWRSHAVMARSTAAACWPCGAGSSPGRAGDRVTDPGSRARAHDPKIGQVLPMADRGGCAFLNRRRRPFSRRCSADTCMRRPRRSSISSARWRCTASGPGSRTSSSRHSPGSSTSFARITPDGIVLNGIAVLALMLARRRAGP
jgi:hypothetical protein